MNWTAGLWKWGENIPQKSFELALRFERNYGIIHGVGSLFVELSHPVLYNMGRQKGADILHFPGDDSSCSYGEIDLLRRGVGRGNVPGKRTVCAIFGTSSGRLKIFGRLQ